MFKQDLGQICFNEVERGRYIAQGIATKKGALHAYPQKERTCQSEVYGHRHPHYEPERQAEGSRRTGRRPSAGLWLVHGGTRGLHLHRYLVQHHRRCCHHHPGRTESQRPQPVSGDHRGDDGHRLQQRDPAPDERPRRADLQDAQGQARRVHEDLRDRRLLPERRPVW